VDLPSTEGSGVRVYAHRVFPQPSTVLAVAWLRGKARRFVTATDNKTITLWNLRDGFV